jgi:hypothetical protein
MLGTFAGALEACHIPASGDHLVAQATGEVESEEGVLVLRRIDIRFDLEARPEEQPTARQVHQSFASKCPLYRTFRNSIAIVTTLAFANRTPR